MSVQSLFPFPPGPADAGTATDAGSPFTVDAGWESTPPDVLQHWAPELPPVPPPPPAQVKPRIKAARPAPKATPSPPATPAPPAATAVQTPEWLPLDGQRWRPGALPETPTQKPAAKDEAVPPDDDRLGHLLDRAAAQKYQR